MFVSEVLSTEHMQSFTSLVTELWGDSTKNWSSLHQSMGMLYHVSSCYLIVTPLPKL